MFSLFNDGRRVKKHKYILWRAIAADTHVLTRARTWPMLFKSEIYVLNNHMRPWIDPTQLVIKCVLRAV